MADIAKLFEQMPSVFKADKAGDMNATIQFDLSGDGGGEWNVAIADGECKVEKGAIDGATATIRMDADDYSDMISGKLNPMTAFMQKKVKVEGDLGTVMKFQSLFG